MAEKVSVGKSGAKDSGEIKSITAKRKAATKGEALTNADILECIEAAGWRLVFNEVTGELEANGESMTDAIQASIMGSMRVQGELQGVDVLKNRFAISDALSSVPMFTDRKRHPLQEYFGMASMKYHAFTQEHPDTSPIKMLRDCLKVNLEGTGIEDGIDWPYECLKYWLCGAIAKVRCGFQNWMLVLSGPQGVGKSLLSRRLGRVAGNRYFNASGINATDKDDKLKRVSTFVWEVEELDGTMRYSDMAHLKAFLTQDDATIRLPYGRNPIHFKNVCSYIGTVNGTEFLRDTTGNRRFLCMEVQAMNRDMLLAMDMDLVWGEARFLLDTELMDHFGNGHIEFPDHLKEIQDKVNEEHRSVSGFEILMNSCVIPSPRCNVSAAQIFDLLKNNYMDRFEGLVRDYMKRRGFEYAKSVKVRNQNGNTKTTSGYKNCAIDTGRYFAVND